MFRRILPVVAAGPARRAPPRAGRLVGSACLLLCLSSAAWPAEHVLDELDISPDAKGSLVKVNLAFPMRVLSSTPPKHGDLIHVQVQPIAAPGIDLCALTARQTLLWSATDNAPLVEVSYEPNSLQVLDRTGANPCDANGESRDPDAAVSASYRVLGTAEISLRFNRAVWYELPGSSDPRELHFLLLGANAGEVNVETTNEIKGEQTTPIEEEPADQPLDVPHTAVPGAAEAAPAPPAEPTDQQNFFIGLLTSSEPFTSTSVPAVAEIANRTFFASRVRVDAVDAYRLNVGFFADEQSANAVLDKIRIQFPEARVIRAEDEDRTAAVRAALRAVPKPAQPTPSGAPPDRMAELVAEARDQIVSKDFSAAIRRLQAVVQDDKTPYRKEAQELLGVAHERALRYEQAANDYRKFLEWYPEGTDSDRVKQRLAGLLAAKQSTREKLRASREERARGAAGKAPGGTAAAGTERKETPTTYDVSGGLSQDWRRENQYVTGRGMDPVTSTLTSNLDVNGRMQSANYRGRARVDAGYAYDFLQNTRFRPRSVFSNVYAELSTRDRASLVRVGRQSAGRGGVLGRFDGGIATYAVNDKVAVNVVGGLPVESSSNAPPNADKYFVGFNTDIKHVWEGWDFNAYYIEQRDFDILDRRAIGGEARYFKNNLSFFSLADADVYYGELNTLLMLGSYAFENRASVNATFDFRKSPYVTTSDAIQGQNVRDLNELQRRLPLSVIEELAGDRAARSTTVSVGGYYPFNETFAVNSDVTASRVGSTPASGGVAAVPSTGWEYMYSSQLLISNLPRVNDTAILGFQYADLARTSSISAFVGTRNVITPQLRIGPTLRFTHSDKSDGTTDWGLMPELQVDYRWKRNMQFQFEGGVNRSLLGQPGRPSTHFDEYFVMTGYRLDF